MEKVDTPASFLISVKTIWIFLHLVGDSPAIDSLYHILSISSFCKTFSIRYVWIWLKAFSLSLEMVSGCWPLSPFSNELHLLICKCLIMPESLNGVNLIMANDFFWCVLEFSVQACRGEGLHGSYSVFCWMNKDWSSQLPRALTRRQCFHWQPRGKAVEDSQFYP